MASNTKNKLKRDEENFYRCGCGVIICHMMGWFGQSCSFSLVIDMAIG
jgi:hypothetical protein